MFGAPLRDFCLRDVEEKPVEGFVVKEPVAEESVVERFVVEESDTEGLDESAKAALKEACASIGYKPAQPENTVEEEPAQPEPQLPNVLAGDLDTEKALGPHPDGTDLSWQRDRQHWLYQIHSCMALGNLIST